MRSNDRAGCADGASRVSRRSHRGRGDRQTKARVPATKRRVTGGSAMNQSPIVITEGEVSVTLTVPKRSLDSNSLNGERNTRNRWGEESKMMGARAATCTTEQEEGKGVLNGKSKGREVDALLLKADHRGRYKRFLVWGWLVPVCLMVPCAHLNFVLMIYLPPSNCTLPFPPPHVSHDAWRSLATPRTSEGELNNCALYDFPSALKDPRYKPGKRHQYTTSNTKDTQSISQGPATSTVQPSTLEDSSTAVKDTGARVIIPSVSGSDTDTFSDIPRTSQGMRASEGDTILHQHAFATPRLRGALEEDTASPRETKNVSKHPSMLQRLPLDGPNTPSKGNDGLMKHHPGSIGHASGTSDTHDHNVSASNQDFDTTEEIQNTSEFDTTTTTTDINTEEALTTSEEPVGTLDDSRTSKKDSSIVENPTNAPTQDHEAQATTTTTTTAYPDLAESRASRYFDPFDDLFDVKKLNKTTTGPKRDPFKIYTKAAMTWQELYPQEPPPSNYTMGCVFGYDFDKTYVQETIPTSFGYTCGESQGINRLLHASMAGNVVGSILFGALADRVGRKWVFMLLSGKVALLGTFFVLARGPWALLFFRFLVSLGLPALYQVVLITALEQVRDGERGLVTSLSSVCFSLGKCLLALLAWLTGHWVNLGLATSLPAILALVYLRLVEESPRWLVARGKTLLAARVLRRVTVNNNDKNEPMPSLSLLRARIRRITTAARVEEEDELSEACRGACGWITGSVTFLLTYPYLSFRVLLYTVCWTVNLVLYFVSTMKYPHVSNNPYINWFCASITEVPGNLLVPLLLRYLGRRALHTVGVFVCSMAFFTGSLLLALGYQESFMGVSGLVLVAKICSAMTFLVVYLQAAELHPTPIRSFVTGLASFVALTVNIFSPSILDVDKPFHAYLLMGFLGLVGTVAAFLLPETAGRSLPQTLHEAEMLYWRPITTTAATATTSDARTSTASTSTTTMTDARRENDRRLPSSFDETEEEEQEEEEEDDDDDDEDEGEVQDTVRSVVSSLSPSFVPGHNREESVL